MSLKRRKGRGRGRRFPVLYDLVGFTGSDLAHANRKPFGDNCGNWHDVYHVDTDRGVVYLKLSVVEDLPIVSFKEKDE